MFLIIIIVELLRPLYYKLPIGSLGFWVLGFRLSVWGLGIALLVEEFWALRLWLWAVDGCWPCVLKGRCRAQEHRKIHHEQFLVTGHSYTVFWLLVSV